MNRQEAIEKLKQKARHHCGEKECYKEGCTKSVELDTVIEIVGQIGKEQKRLYTVEIPNPNCTLDKFYTVLRRTSDGKIEISEIYSKDYKKKGKFQLTEEEIKQDFAWAWNAGFVEEVE